MSKLLTTPATISKVQTMSHRSLRLQVDTNEALSDEEVAKIMSNYEKFGYFCFIEEKHGDIKPEDLVDLPKLPATDESSKKTPSYVQNAPRRLTQAQLFTLNSTTQSRSQTQRNRLSAPTNTNVLALLPLRGVNSLSPGKMLIDDFNLDDAERVYFGPVDLERFRVRLVDDQGYTVNLNGNNWSFTMAITSLYQY